MLDPEARRALAGKLHKARTASSGISSANGRDARCAVGWSWKPLRAMLMGLSSYKLRRSHSAQIEDVGSRSTAVATASSRGRPQDALRQHQQLSPSFRVIAVCPGCQHPLQNFPFKESELRQETWCSVRTRVAWISSRVGKRLASLAGRDGQVGCMPYRVDTLGAPLATVVMEPLCWHSGLAWAREGAGATPQECLAHWVLGEKLPQSCTPLQQQQQQHRHNNHSSDDSKNDGDHDHDPDDGDDADDDDGDDDGHGDDDDDGGGGDADGDGDDDGDDDDGDGDSDDDGGGGDDDDDVDGNHDGNDNNNDDNQKCKLE